MTRLTAGDRALEHDCGSVQATRPLVARGLAITAAAWGPALAVIARRRLSTCPAAQMAPDAVEERPHP